jgi:hypothetical protein
MLGNERLISAFLYLQCGETPPDDAPDEWFLGADPFREWLPYVGTFINETEVLLDTLETLELNDEELPEQQYQFHFYEAAKRTFDYDKTRLRVYFMWLYHILFRKDSGARWGILVSVMGVEEFISFVRRRFENPFAL